MTALQYTALMLIWFGNEIASHPNLSESQYQESLKILLPLSNEERRTLANN